jgi:hypothetical protein
MRCDTLTIQPATHLPDTTVMQPGILYVSETYGAAAHLCACGCGAETYTPLRLINAGGWTLSDGPTLRPSIGNYGFPCGSHYYVTNGEIQWL